jgi:hypothetical protein
MKYAKKALPPLLILGLLAVGAAACGDRTPGENLDRALDKTGEKIKDAGEAIQPK